MIRFLPLRTEVSGLGNKKTTGRDAVHYGTVVFLYRDLKGECYLRRMELITTFTPGTV